VTQWRDSDNLDVNIDLLQSKSTFFPTGLWISNDGNAGYLTRFNLPFVHFNGRRAASPDVATQRRYPFNWYSQLLTCNKESFIHSYLPSWKQIIFFGNSKKNVLKSMPDCIPCFLVSDWKDRIFKSLCSTFNLSRVQQERGKAQGTCNLKPNFDSFW